MNKEIAQAHWDEFIEPLIILVIEMFSGEVDKPMLDVMEYLYVMAMVHGAKHEREN